MSIFFNMIISLEAMFEKKHVCQIVNVTFDTSRRSQFALPRHMDIFALRINKDMLLQSCNVHQPFSWDLSFLSVRV